MTLKRDAAYWHSIAERAMELLRMLIADNSEENKRKATAFLGQVAKELRSVAARD